MTRLPDESNSSPPPTGSAPAAAGHDYRLIAIDLDGTLLSPAGQVTDVARAAVHRALAAGFVVCFATGRNWTESRAILEAVGHQGPMVFVGGAMVVDTQRQLTLRRTDMHPDLARQVCRLLEDEGHAVCALQDTSIAGVDYLFTGEAEPNEATRQWLKVTSASVRRVPRLADHPHEHTIRLGIVAAPEAVAVAKRDLIARFGARVVCHSLFVPAYDVEVMEVFDPAVNKWQGVLQVAGLYGVEPGQVVAVGDDVNDVPMVKAAGLGVAMGNARPELLAVARRVIRSNAEEGLAEFLEELVQTRAAAGALRAGARDGTDVADRIGRAAPRAASEPGGGEPSGP